MAKKKKVVSKKAAKKKTARKAAPPETEMLIVASKTREALQAHGCNVAADALKGLNVYVYWLIEQAAKRADANGRKTVRPHDFLLM